MTLLTGVVLSPGGTPITGTLYLQLSQDANLFAGPCGGPAAVASSPPYIFNLQNGVIVGPGIGPFQVHGADCLSPSNLTYHMTVTGASGGTVLEKEVIITGPSVDLGTLTPVSPTGPVTPGGQLTGDVVGPASFNTVIKIQNKYVSAAAPLDLQVLAWNAASGWWEPKTLGLGGAGAAGQVAFWSAPSTLAGDGGHFWDNTNKRLGIGTAVPVNPLTVKGPSGNAQFAITISGATFGELYIDNNSDLTIRASSHNVFLQPGSGNVGIGTTTVPSRLTVNGTVELSAGSGGVIKFQDGTTQATAVSAGAYVLLQPGPAHVQQAGILDVASIFFDTLASTTAYPPSWVLISPTAGGAVGLRPLVVADLPATITSPSTVTSADNNSTNATMYPLFTSVAGGISPVLTSSLGLTYNPSTKRLGAVTMSATTGIFGDLSFSTSLSGPPLGPSMVYITPYPGGGSPAFRTLVAGDLPGGVGVSGSGAATQAAFWSGTTALSGDNAFYWDNTNKRLGIGTTGPTSPLTVAGTIEITSGSGGVIKFADGTTQASAAAAGGTVGGSGATGQAAFWSASSSIAGDNAFFWDNTNKRLGVGTVTPGLALHLKTASGQAGINIEHTGTADYSHVDFYEGATQQGVVQCLGSTFAGARQNTLEIGQLNSGDITLRTSAIERVRILAGGNVGIGTTGPTTRLGVQGQVQISPSAPISPAAIGLEIICTSVWTSESCGFYIRSGNGAGEQGLAFNTDKANAVASIQSLQPSTGARPLVLQPLTGNVGIGNNVAPGFPLHIYVTSGNVYAMLESGSATGIAAALAFKTGNRRWEIGQSPGIGDNTLTIYDATAPAVRFKIDTAGAVTIGGSLTAGSFNGPGTGLTGTAASLTVGAATYALAVPQNSQAGGYTLVVGDRGKHILAGAGVTVPASVFSAGDIITIYNNTAGNITITQGASVTMYLAGTATTGNRTSAQRGIATVLCVASNTFVISGGGLT